MNAVGRVERVERVERGIRWDRLPSCSGPRGGSSRVSSAGAERWPERPAGCHGTWLTRVDRARRARVKGAAHGALGEADEDARHPGASCCLGDRIRAGARPRGDHAEHPELCRRAQGHGRVRRQRLPARRGGVRRPPGGRFGHRRRGGLPAGAARLPRAPAARRAGGHRRLRDRREPVRQRVDDRVRPDQDARPPRRHRALAHPPRLARAAGRPRDRSAQAAQPALPR